MSVKDDPLDEHPMNPINQEGYEEDFPHPDDLEQEQEECLDEEDQ
jgi:hypothetical protein